jgi:hypothetical protein
MMTFNLQISTRWVSSTAGEDLRDYAGIIEIMDEVDV